MRLLTFILITMLHSFTSCSANDDNNNEMPAPVNPAQQRLKITIGDRELTAVIYDNATSRDFIAQLPLRVDMDDYAGSEKIFYPPQTLSTSERRAVTDPAVGDINVYAPWGNIAIFYKNYTGSRDLIRIGRIESGMEVLNVPGKISHAIFELIETEEED